jgi:hypothetical protein
MKLQLQLKCDLDETDSVYLNHLSLGENLLTLQIAPDGEHETKTIALRADKVDQLIEFLKKVREEL